MLVRGFGRQVGAEREVRLTMGSTALVRVGGYLTFSGYVLICNDVGRPVTGRDNRSDAASRSLNPTSIPPQVPAPRAAQSRQQLAG